MNPLELIIIRPLNADLLRTAWSATSFHPEERGKRCQLDYQSSLEEFRRLLIEKTTGRDPYFAEQAAIRFQQYAGRYHARYTAYVSAESRCMSSFITGPSNFPVARAEKRNATAHKRLEDLVEGSRKDRARILSWLTPAEDRSIRTEDPEAATKLAAKAESVKQGADRMVELNKRYRALRKTTDSDDQAYMLLFEETTEAERKHIEINRRFCPGGTNQPYPSFDITNERARQKTAAARSAHIERLKTVHDSEWQGANARVLDNVQANRIQIFFPGKPDEATRTRLKRSGFRWSPTEGAWQAYRTYGNTLLIAKELAGVQEPTEVNS